MRISILIPIYQAHRIVEDTVATVSKKLDSMNTEYEILLRDDGSLEDMRAIFERITFNYSKVRCFYNDRNYGLGFTLRKLFEEARGEILIYMDCDLPFGVDVLDDVLNEIKHSDIVVASRYPNHGRKVGWLRLSSSQFYFWMCRRLFSISVRDIGSGTVAFKRQAVQALTLNAQGFDIHIEIFLQAVQKKLSIKEIPAASYQHRQGTFSIFKHGYPVVWNTILLWQRYHNQRSSQFSAHPV